MSGVVTNGVMESLYTTKPATVPVPGTSRRLEFPNVPEFPLTPEQCETAWSVLPPDTEVGISLVSDRCPLARLAQALLDPPRKWYVCTPSAYWLDDLGFRHYYLIRSWHHDFMCCADRHHLADNLFEVITAAQALRYLRAALREPHPFKLIGESTGWNVMSPYSITYSS